jgi:glutamate N-acetyltransferase/amino-acid N-acetyltransferase
MTVESNLNVTRLPLGFKSAGINCGVRRYRPDLGLVYSEELAVAAGVFTVNECKAAPVVYSQKILPSAQIKAIITNSGQANAATGAEGIENNLRMAQTVAGELKCETHQVLTASTGVIGQQLSLLKIISAVPDLIKRSSDDADNFSLSILTTDLVPKTATKDITLSEGRIRITGVCKGSGMIHPNMATMLAYIFTDVSLSPEKAQFYLGKAVNLSFNRISVDGDCSTNDTVFLMANGAAGVKISSTMDEEVFFSIAGRCLSGPWLKKLPLTEKEQQN